MGIFVQRLSRGYVPVCPPRWVFLKRGLLMPTAPQSGHPRLPLSGSSPPGIINTHVLRVIHTYVQRAAGGAVPQLRRERTGKQLGLKTQQTLHIYVEGTVIFTFNTLLGLMES